MRGMAVAFFSLCMVGTTQASSLIYFSDDAPPATPSVVMPTTDPMAAVSVVQAGEDDMPAVTQEKVSAIPKRNRPEGATVVIRDGVVGSALPRHVDKPAFSNGKQPATEASAKAEKDGSGGAHRTEVAR